MRKKIALLITNLNGGGAERVVLLLANGMAAMGHDVDLVLLQKKGTYIEQGLVSKKVNVLDLGATRIRHGLLPWMRYLKRVKPDVAISHLTQVNVMAIIGKVLSLSAVKIIACEHNTISAQEAGSWFYRLLLAIVYRLAYKIVTVSESASPDLQHFAFLPPSKICTIYNPVDVESIQRAAKKECAHPWLEELGQHPCFIAAGRLVPAKNFTLLLRAFAKMQKETQSRLIILGQGEERENLVKLAEDLNVNQSVDIHGFVSNPYAFFAHASGFVLSSNYEGLPTVLIEALACNCAVVSTDCPNGPQEILEAGKYGYLTPVGDIDALARAMIEVIRRPIKNGIKRAEFFSVERAVNNYLELFCE